MAFKCLREGEEAARAHNVKYSGWHAFRGGRVNRNRVGRNLPPAAAAKLGGWKNAYSMQAVCKRLPDLDQTAEALARVAEQGGAG